jgi:hypothetical protein
LRQRAFAETPTGLQILDATINLRFMTALALYPAFDFRLGTSPQGFTEVQDPSQPSIPLGTRFPF